MKKYMILLIIVAGMWACDNFLDVKPKTEIVETIFFKNEQGFRDGLYGVYSSMGKSPVYGQCMTFLVTDLLAQYYTGMQAGAAYYSISTFDHTHDNARGLYNKMWNGTYQTIGYVNNVLKNLELKGPGSLEYYSLYKGEALGVRAFLHFDLIRMFAPHITSPDAQGIPFVKYYTPLVTPFSSVGQIYGMVKSELKEAEQLLAQDEELMTLPRNRSLDDGFFSCREIHCNLYAVQAILARVYWMEDDQDSAYIYAKKVIDSRKFAFVAKTAVKTSFAGVVNDQETIWGLNSETFYKDVYSAFYETSPMGMSNLFPHKDFINLSHMNTGEGEDFRSEWVRPRMDDKGATPRLMKILNENKALGKTDITDPGISGMNLIRIPELYLIVAEALLTKGQANEARIYFDQLIESRGLIGFAKRNPVRELKLEDILVERRKEFVGEGQEWFSMKRLNKDVYNPNTLKTYPGSDEIYTLSIPDDEFEFRYEEEDVKQ